MPAFADFTLAQWIGLIGLIVFSGMLVWSLVIGHKTPPGKQ